MDDLLFMGARVVRPCVTGRSQFISLLQRSVEIEPRLRRPLAGRGIAGPAPTAFPKTEPC